MTNTLKRHIQSYEATIGRMQFEKIIFSVGDVKHKMVNLQLKTFNVR